MAKDRDTSNGVELPVNGNLDIGNSEDLEKVIDYARTVRGVINSSGVITASNAMTTSANIGTANTGVTAVEYGDGYNHTTVLTVSQADALTIADNAALADGYKLYDFPAGSVIVDGSYMTMAVTAASTEAQSDTPDVGLGTTVASGDVATLDGTAAFENVLTGQTTADANGTASVATVTTGLAIETGDSHSLYFNVADTWANDTGGDLTADIAGTVVIHWKFNA